jgi:hypothetical protein
MAVRYSSSLMVCDSPTVSLSRQNHQSFLASGMAIIWGIALARLSFRSYFNNHYGYFRDEFDYIVCGEHLAWR